jgi:hypothetical protein
VLCEPQNSVEVVKSVDSKAVKLSESNPFSIHARLWEAHLRHKEFDPNYGKVGNFNWYYYPCAIGFSYFGAAHAATIFWEQPALSTAAISVHLGIIYIDALLNYWEFYLD